MNVDVPRMLDALGIEPKDWGSEIWAPCPNPDHHESRPSWSIHNAPHEPNNGHHYCFGCQFGGGPVDLVAKVIGITYGSARRWLAEKGLLLSGAVPLDVEMVIIGRQSSGMLIIPAGLRGGPLESWVPTVRKYVASRGISAEQVLRWDLHYAIHGSMGGRVFFPVADEANRWQSWHARSYCGQTMRYKNASNEDGHDPGAIFGMRRWPKLDARKRISLVLTEGAIDALACERTGRLFIAAIGGSEPTPRQLLKLLTWPRILVATDGDKAGQHVYASLAYSIGRRVDVRRVEIPPDFDAAEVAERSLSELRKLIYAADKG